MTLLKTQVLTAALLLGLAACGEAPTLDKSGDAAAPHKKKKKKKKAKHLIGHQALAVCHEGEWLEVDSEAVRAHYEHGDQDELCDLSQVEDSDVDVEYEVDEE